MIPKEILKKVKRIEIQTRGLVNDVFSGEYHSVFKGRGMEFSEVREYLPGDDIRTIDWNVTARMGHPFVKIFEEERELTVMLVVDVSSSSAFGTVAQMKSEIAAEICDRVAVLHDGRLLFCGRTGDLAGSGESLERSFLDLVRGDAGA